MRAIGVDDLREHGVERHGAHASPSPPGAEPPRPGPNPGNPSRPNERNNCVGFSAASCNDRSITAFSSLRVLTYDE